jgi:hypothetical protein
MKDLERLQKDLKYYERELLEKVKEISRRGDLILSDMERDPKVLEALGDLIWCNIRINDYKTMELLAGGEDQ